jgi:TonB family protein
MTRIAFVLTTFVYAVLFWAHTDDVCVVHAESLDYPAIARHSRVEGDVTVLATAGTDGRVESARATGPAMLRETAEQNVKRWIFRVSEAREIKVVYEFRLATPEVGYWPPTHTAFDFPGHVRVTTNLPQIND